MYFVGFLCLMVICKENHLKTCTDTNENHLMMGGQKVGEICSAENVWEEFVFEVLAKHRAGSYQTKTPREGWYHSESLQQVSWP